jgi:cytochrome c
MINKRESVIKTCRLSHASVSASLALLALGAFFAILPSPPEGQGAQDGKALFEKRCTGCHALDADHEGPRLRGVVGRMAGTVKTFKYSTQLQNAKITWDETNLDKWLTDTDSVVPDNDMSFRVPKHDERAAIITYLKSLSSR